MTVFEDLLVSHQADHSHQVDRVDVAHRPDVGVITAGRMVAAQGQDIRQAAEGLVTSIVGLIEGKPVQSTLMAPRLIVRDSCGTHT